MSWESSLESVSACAAAVVAVFAMIAQSKSTKSNLTADLVMKLDDRFALPEFKKVRSRAARALRNHVNEEEADDVFDFFEMIGLFTRRKALDAEIVHSFFFHWINVYWTAGKDHVAKKQSQTHSAWKEFGDLYLEVLKIEEEDDPSSEDIALSPEKLASYLEDEIALSGTYTLTITPSGSQTSGEQQ